MRFVTCTCTAALSALFTYPAQAQSPPTVTFSASPTSIPNGQSSTLAWTSANATACSGTGKGFSPSGPSGSLAVSPKTTTTYGITCTGAGGSASQSVAVAVTAAPTLTVGETVAATGTIYAYSTPTPNTPAIGSEWPGNQGVVIGGPASNGSTWWEVAFNDGLTGWVFQSAVAAVSPTAPPVSFSANPASIPPWASSTLSWSSTNATSCTGAGFSPSGVSGSLSVSPTATTVYSITCTGSGGSTTQSAQVVVNPYPTIGMTVAAKGTDWVYPTPSTSPPAIGSEWPGNQGVVIGGPTSNGGHGGRSPSTTALPGGLIRAVSRSYRQRRRQSRSARISRASPPASRRRFHGRRPTRLPAAERASLHRAPQDLSPFCRLQPPFTASPAQGVADRQLNQRKWS